LKFNNIIIDLNNIFWRSVISIVKKLSEDHDENTFYSLTIQDTLERIMQLKKTYGHNDTILYIAHDNPFSRINERELIDSTYKHARKNKNVPPVFYKSLEKLIEILKFYDNSLYLISHAKCEADDLVLTVLKHVKGTTLMVSADMDWARGISDDGISWFNFSKIYDVDIFTKEYGFNPSGNGVKIYKAIHGDKSDCIENAVPHIPQKLLAHIVENYDSIYDLLNRVFRDDDIPKHWKLKIQEAQIQLKINYQLVDFLPLDLSFGDISYKCEFNVEKLRSWFRMLDMQFENRFIDPKKDANSFLERKKYKRIVTI
jgi:5'-3' exonuclease